MDESPCLFHGACVVSSKSFNARHCINVITINKLTCTSMHKYRLTLTTTTTTAMIVGVHRGYLVSIRDESYNALKCQLLVRESPGLNPGTVHQYSAALRRPGLPLLVGAWVVQILLPPALNNKWFAPYPVLVKQASDICGH